MKVKDCCQGVCGLEKIDISNVIIDHVDQPKWKNFERTKVCNKSRQGQS